MARRRKRRSSSKAKSTKNMYCVRYKRVRVKGQGVSKRCAKFAKKRGRKR